MLAPALVPSTANRRRARATRRTGPSRLDEFGRCGTQEKPTFARDWVLTSRPSHRHQGPEAKGHRDLRPCPQPTEPLRRRRPCRCLQHMAPLQRTGSLRRASFRRRLLHHELGYREVSSPGVCYCWCSLHRADGCSTGTTTSTPRPESPSLVIRRSKRSG